MLYCFSDSSTPIRAFSYYTTSTGLTEILVFVLQFIFYSVSKFVLLTASKTVYFLGRQQPSCRLNVNYWGNTSYLGT